MISAESHLSSEGGREGAARLQDLAVGFTLMVYIMNKVSLNRINGVFFVKKKKEGFSVCLHYFPKPTKTSCFLSEELIQAWGQILVCCY